MEEDNVPGLKSFAQYCQERAYIIVGLYVLVFALFGMWAYHHMVTFDAEGLYSYAGGQVWYDIWIEMGRWALYTLKRILGVVAINPFFSTTVFFLLFPASAVLWGYALYVWNNYEQPKWALVLFSAIFLTHPMWAQQFGYRNQMEVMSIALVLAPLGVLLCTEWIEKRVAWQGVIGLTLVAFVFGCYQSFIFLCAEAFLVYLLLAAHVTRSESAEARGEQNHWIKAALCFGFVVLAFVAYSIMQRLFIWHYGITPSPSANYLTGQFLWFSQGLNESIQAVLSHIGKFSYGNGLEFSALFGVEAVVLIGIIIAMCARKKARCGFSAFISIALLIVPFALEIATAGDIVIRSQFALVFAIAFLAVFEMGALFTVCAGCKRKAGIVALASMLAVATIVPQMQVQTRLLYTDVIVMDEDFRNMQQIYYQAMELGAHEGDAMCLVGTRHNNPGDTIAESELVGYSYFEHAGLYDERKTIEAMQAYGLPVSFPSDGQRASAIEEAASLAVWPTGGSISVHDGYYVVRMGEDLSRPVV